MSGYTYRPNTANQRAAKARSAERRQCPSCGRKSAIVKDKDGMFHYRWCRWCDWHEMTERT